MYNIEDPKQYFAVKRKYEMAMKTLLPIWREVSGCFGRESITLCQFLDLITAESIAGEALECAKSLDDFNSGDEQPRVDRVMAVYGPLHDYKNKFEGNERRVVWSDDFMNLKSIDRGF